VSILLLHPYLNHTTDTSCRGLLNSFGAFQTYYETVLLTSSTASAISWIGSVQIFCFMAIAILVGPLYDAGYCRALILTGAGFITVGFMLTSISTTYWQILLAQGICVGLGTCCISVPSIAVVPMYFKKRRALAMSTATLGSGLGATIHPLIFQSLTRTAGFGWAVRVIGFIALVMCGFAFMVIRPRTNPKSAWREGGFSMRWFCDASAFRERPFIIFSVAIFFNNLAFFQPSFYLESYALEHGMRGHDLTRYLLSIMNASSIPGRIIASLIADKVGALDTFAVICAFSSASIFYWISVSNVAGNIAFPVLYGFFSGGVVALASVVITYITPDMSRLGTRLGMISILKGIASLIGPPISGALLGATGNYLGVQLFSALGMMLTALFSGALRVDIARVDHRASPDQSIVENGERQDQGNESK
jgi:MFS family permease